MKARDALVKLRACKWVDNRAESMLIAVPWDLLHAVACILQSLDAEESGGAGYAPRRMASIRAPREPSPLDAGEPLTSLEREALAKVAEGTAPRSSPILRSLARRGIVKAHPQRGYRLTARGKKVI